MLRLTPTYGLGVICAGTLVVPMDSAVNVAFPAIIRAFGLPVREIQGVVIAYTLAYAALMLVFGRIGDLLGHRRVFLAGNAGSVVAFLLCAASPSLPLLLLARIAQGVSAALVLSCGPALATALYPEKQRTRVLGIYTMVFGAGAAAGSIIGGLLLQWFDWPSVFWFRAPLSLAAFLLAWGLAPSAPSGPREPINLGGACLLVLTIAAFLLGLGHLQTVAGAVAYFLLFAVAATGFIMHEYRAAFPIIDLRLFCNTDFALFNASHVASSLIWFTVPLLMPFFLDRVLALPARQIGILLAVSSIATAAAAAIAGRLASHIPPQRLAVLGAALMTAGQALIGTITPSLSLTALGAWLAVQGAGFGLFQVAYFDIVTATMPRENRGVAGSLVMMTRTVGVVIGATTLVLFFPALRSSTPTGDMGAFIASFHRAFRFTVLLPAAIVLAGLMRGWLSAQSSVSR